VGNCFFPNQMGGWGVGFFCSAFSRFFFPPPTFSSFHLVPFEPPRKRRIALMGFKSPRAAGKDFIEKVKKAAPLVLPDVVWRLELEIKLELYRRRGRERWVAKTFRQSRDLWARGLRRVSVSAGPARALPFHLLLFHFSCGMRGRRMANQRRTIAK